MELHSSSSSTQSDPQSDSDIVGQTLDDVPPDPTNVEDMIHAALFSGHAEQALVHAAKLDPWLAAHLADFMSVLSLIETAIEDE